MADQTEVTTTNPCCILWKERYVKLQHKYKRCEDARNALKKGIAVYESQFNKVQKAYEDEKLRASNEKMEKEKESAARVLLEKEISTLKSEVLSLSQKVGSAPEKVTEELKLLQGRVSEREKEIISLREQLQKKRADEACESSKADQELRILKARLLSFETETKQLKTDLQIEKARADSEKKRADEMLRTAKTEQVEGLKADIDYISTSFSLKPEDQTLETELCRLKELLDKEKKRADIQTKKAETEKKNANKLKEMLKSEQSRANEQKKLADVERKKAEDFAQQLPKFKGEADLETDICRLKELLDKEKKRADSERKKAETEKKNSNRVKEMLKSEQSRANEQKKLADVEKKQAEEFAQQLQKLKFEVDAAKSKLVSEGSKLKDVNKKNLEAEKKKTIQERKKAEEQQKIAEMSTKHALEEKQLADTYKLQAMTEKSRSDKLAQELEDAKQSTKNVCTELIDPSHVLSQKDLEAKSVEMKLLKKRLKLEKERVKHADKVAELEKKCKKVVEEELHQLKLEFARFSNRVGLCNCFSVCNASKSFLEKDGNVNLKRKFMHPDTAKEFVKPTCADTKSSGYFKSSLDCPVSSLPISRTCTESTSGTASKLKPLLGGSNRKKLDSSALVSSMASFSDRQLVGSQGICQKSNLQLPSEVDNNTKSPLRVRNKDGSTRKRKRLPDTEGITEHAKIAKNMSALDVVIGNMNKPLKEVMQPSVLSIEQTGEPSIRTVGDEDANFNATRTCHNELEIFKEMFDGDCMKLLNLDNEVEEERYRAAVERPLSPTLVNIEFESIQSDDLADRRQSEINHMSTVKTFGDSAEILRRRESGKTNTTLESSACIHEDEDTIPVTGLLDLAREVSGNHYGSVYNDSCRYIVVFPEITDSSIRSKIFNTTRTFASQCCAFSQSDCMVKDIVSALSANELLSPKEKVCAFFSLFLKSFSSIALTNFNHVNKNFSHSIDIFSTQLKKVMFDEETRTMLTNVCNLDELINLIQSFIIDGRVLGPTDTSSETLSLPDTKASLHQLVLGAVLLASVGAAFDRIDSICETLCTISRITNSSSLTILHVFGYICGENWLAHGDYSLMMTVVKSLVTYCESDNLSSGFPPCAKCPFSVGAVSIEEVASLLLKQLSGYCMNNFGVTTYKSATVPDDNLCEVLSLLELLSSEMSWGWVYEKIISELLKFLEVRAAETPLSAVLALLGQIARLGIDASGFQNLEVENIRVKLSSFISQSISIKAGIQVQFAAVKALLGTTSVSFQEFCNPPPLVCPPTGTDCVQKWFSLLSDEHKVLSARHLMADVS